MREVVSTAEAIFIDADKQMDHVAIKCIEILSEGVTEGPKLKAKKDAINWIIDLAARVRDKQQKQNEMYHALHQIKAVIAEHIT